jgi:hypothetical protein
VAQSFLDVARELIDSPEAKTDYAEDPDGFLAARGLDGFTAADLEVAVGFVAEAVPAPVARQLAPASLASPAPEPAALARLAATTEVEAEVRDAEPGTLGLAAVIDPGGELDLPDSVDFTTLTPAPPEEEDEEGPEVAGAEGANGEQAGASGAELPETDENAAPDVAQPMLDEAPGDADDGEQDEQEEEEPARDRDFELDPELQPTVDPTAVSDTGLSATGPVAETAEVEPPPEETYDDLI